MTKPTTTQTEAAGAMQHLINQFQPDVVVTEKIDEKVRDTFVGHLKAAVERTAAQNYVLDVSVQRSRNFANKYEEAAAYGQLYPELQALVPPVRMAFGHEPARLIPFDALALAHKVLQRPTHHLAAAMG